MSHEPEQSPESQHSANPDTPPPEYSVHVPNQNQASSQHSATDEISGHYPHREQSLFGSSTGFQFVPPSSFGPTPLVQSQPTLGLLPYHDPRSAHSIEAATSRARWRFVGAGFWAIGLIACLFVLGVLRGLQRAM